MSSLWNTPPRFDKPEVDPTSLKSTLARLANATLSQLWLNSPLKDRISIGCHSLENSGAGDGHLARYKNLSNGRYDGVHFYGNNGREDYTNSVMTILKLTLPERNFAKTNDGCGTAQTENHSQCPQARYQKQSKYQPNVQTKNRFSVFNSNSGNY